MGLRGVGLGGWDERLSEDHSEGAGPIGDEGSVRRRNSGVEWVREKLEFVGKG